MTRRYLLPLLAVLGLFVIIIAMVIDNRPQPAVTGLPWPTAPFSSYVAGAGIVEASAGNIAVGTPVSGIVTALYVSWGNRVTVGTPLFKIDDGDLQAQRIPALAGVQEARARLMQAQQQLKLGEAVPDRRAISKEDMNSRSSAVAIAVAGLAAAQARVEQIRLEAERRTVRARAPGKVLQINVNPGEFAQSGMLAKPLVLIGNDERLFLRVDVDQFDALRIKPGAAAAAFARGAPARQARLRFERIDPYVGPKLALTGSATERVDTRVLQVIYSFAPDELPAYIGQQLDVYIEAPPAASAQQPDKAADRAVRAAPAP